MFTIPAIVDDVKRTGPGAVTRLVYFSIACDTPAPGWHLQLSGRKIPFVLVDLAGIIAEPINGRPRFTHADEIESTFAAIEKIGGLYVDTNDLWIPNRLFDTAREKARRTDVVRLGLELFRAALMYRADPQAYGDAFGEDIDWSEFLKVSPEETAAFKTWSTRQVEEARAGYHQREHLALAYKDAERRG